MVTPRRLPRGRTALPPEEVTRVQRGRLCRAMIEAVAEKGFAATSVQDVLQRSGVARQSFYQVFSSKLDCFLAAFDLATGYLKERITEGLAPSPGDPDGGVHPLDLYERGLTAYLDALRTEWPAARLFLAEIYAAGPDAVERRAANQELLVSLHADVLGATDERGMLACRMIVAAMASLVTGAAATDRRDRLDEAAEQLRAYVRALWDAGFFAPA
ncbi:TetR/AcrR family transcriptional regulator [Actinomadura flavalba]|uniref:TetR/AcrR family transcriptional regulator n=1 Tax=Actinomadura flavalba TaxID=1120938 RepID=UPI00035D47D5|nr:TetR/AcrR family transcriptional regulator [Actinomadura flavalba]